MPDRVENLLASPLNDGRESLGDKLQRESELLRDGLSAGALHRLNEMYENPGSTALTVGGCALLGAGLNLARRAGGRWGTVAKVATYGFGAALGVDVIRRGIPSIGAMADTWNSPTNLEVNKGTIAGMAGTALVDYPVMFASGYAGYKVAGRIPMGALSAPSVITETALDPTMKLGNSRGLAVEQAIRPTRPSEPALPDFLAQDSAVNAARLPELLAKVVAARPRVLADGLTGTAEAMVLPRTLPGGGKPSSFLPEIVEARPASLPADLNPTIETVPSSLTGPKRLGWHRFSDEVAAILDQPFNEPPPSPLSEVALSVPNGAKALAPLAESPGAFAVLGASRAGGALAAPKSTFVPSTIPADMLRFAGVDGQTSLSIHVATQNKLIDRVRPVLSNGEQPAPDQRIVAPPSEARNENVNDTQDPHRDELRAKIRDALNKSRR
ncbi:MAG: hypothetical protein K2W95_10345 [Candidatus Obscuribacterales bacterium]|nr:hypothetical protein [Candidatus Obscuribacterales bacterium]